MKSTSTTMTTATASQQRSPHHHQPQPQQPLHQSSREPAPLHKDELTAHEVSAFCSASSHQPASSSNAAADSRYKNYLIDKLLNETPPLTPQIQPGESGAKPSLSPSHSKPSFEYGGGVQRSESREDVASEAGTYTIDDSPDVALVSDFNDASLPSKPAASGPRAGAADPSDVMSARAAIDETFGIIKRPVISGSAADRTAANLSSSDESSSRRPLPGQHETTPVKPATPTHRVRNKTYSLAKDIMVLNHIDNLAATPPSPAAAAAASKLIESASTTAPFSEINSNVKKTNTYDIIFQKFNQPTAAAKTVSTNIESFKYNTYNKNKDELKRTGANDDSYLNDDSVVSNGRNETTVDKLNASAIETSRTINTQMLLGDTDKLIEELNKKTSRKSPSVPLISNKSPPTLSSASSSSTGSAAAETPSAGRDMKKKSSDGGSTTITPRNFRENNQIGEILAAAAANKSTNGSFYTNKPKSWVIPTDLSFDDDDNEEDCNVSTTRATVNAGGSRPNTSRATAPLAAPESTKAENLILQSKKVGNGGMAFDFVMDNHHHHHNRPTHRSEPIGDDNNSSILSSGLSSTESVSQTSQASFNSSMSITRGYELHRQAVRSKTAAAASSALHDNSSSVNTSPLHTPKSTATTALSLGAKIQIKAKENGPKTGAETGGSNSLDNSNHSPPPPMANQMSPVHGQNALRRRASDNTIVSSTTTASTATPPPPTTTQYTNRALLLRQQKARAKRESLDRSQVRSADIDSQHHMDLALSTPRSKTASSIVKKTPTTGSSNGPALVKTSNLNSSVSSLSGANKTPRTTSQSKKLVSRSNSRNASPNPNTHLYSAHHHQNNLMTNSLNLPSGAALPNGVEFSLKDSFLRRKNYDPLKAVEQERLKKLQKSQPSNGKPQSKLQISLNETLDNNGNDDEDDSTAESSSSFSIPVNSLTANISNKQKPLFSKSSAAGFARKILSPGSGVVKKPDPPPRASQPAVASEKSPSSPSSTLKKPLLRTLSLRSGGAMASPSAGSIPVQYRSPPGSVKSEGPSPATRRQLTSRQKLIDEYNSKKRLPADGKSSGIFSVSNDANYDLFNDQSSHSSSQSLNNSIELTNDSPLSTYEKILQSTLQRLCIRLIQMSTGVLDKIGDNSTGKLCDTASVFSSSGNTELERMQQLAKLVNSMQLVNEHIQIIDSTLFSAKPEDSYMKELTRIRQEVDNLKQTAAMNTVIGSSSSTSVANMNGGQV